MFLLNYRPFIVQSGGIMNIQHYVNLELEFRAGRKAIFVVK